MKRALVLMAEGTEELEVVTIVDILRRAEVEVVLASSSLAPITASRGIRLLADALWSEQDIADYDALILPGGAAGTQHFEEDRRVLALVKQAAEREMILAAICAAPRVLHKANVLSGKRVTSYPGALDPEDTSYFYLETSVVKDGFLITSRGPGTALDFALALVEQLCGLQVRCNVEGPLMRS